MRKQASAVLSKARLGQDAVAEKRSAVGKRTALLGDTVQRYLADREPKLRPRYFLEIKRQLEQDWKPLHAQSVDGVTRHVVVERVDEIAAGQGEVAADRAPDAQRSSGWAIQRGYCETDPTLNIAARAEGTARDHVFWQKANSRKSGTPAMMMTMVASL